MLFICRGRNRGLSPVSEIIQGIAHARLPASRENPMNTRDAALTKVRELAHFIGGKQVRGESGRFGDVFNPTTGAPAAKVPLASTAEVERVIANAKDAFAGWAEASPLARARGL